MSHVTSFVVDCKLLDTQILHVGVAHCYKEANKCVGTPAKMASCLLKPRHQRLLMYLILMMLSCTLMDSALVPLMFPSFSWMNVVLPTQKKNQKL